MKIAIIGTGLAGLATGFVLTRLGCQVTFFDKKGIGCGASGVAAGLMHPYVGGQIRTSLWSKEALEESKALILRVSPKSVIEKGIVRITQSEEQKKLLLSYQDVERIGQDSFLIKSGIVVDTGTYLQALFKDSNSELILEEITNFHSLQHFDRVLLATGYEADKLLPQSKIFVSKKKGQILDVCLDQPMRSTIAKGYLVKGIHEYHWGSTYEMNPENESPDIRRALELLEKNEFPFVSPPKIIGCRAGIRLVRKGFYVPIATKVAKKIWWFGALGSRGLLYHAHLASKLAKAMLCDDPLLIPKECRWNQNSSF